MPTVSCGQVSITGNFRENNEDNLYVDDQSRFFIVADGMGGQSAGEKASELAVELVPKKLIEMLNFADDPTEKVIQVIDDSVSHANSEIMALGEVDPDMANMGTTIVFLVVVGDRFFVGGVGDSRVYQLRDDKLKQLTIDHSLTEALVQAGTISREEADNHRYKNVLYRYLGSKEGGNGTDAQEITPMPGDRYFLCSDGVTDGAKDDVITSILVSESDSQVAAQKIVEAAQEGGSKDNITCLVLDVNA